MESQKRTENKFQALLRRWIFLLLSTSVMVFFSEKMYWYVQGYAYIEPLEVYIFGTYAFFLVLQVFNVREFWSMFLAAAVFPLYVEGLFTGIITTDFTGIMFLYFIGWHTTLSVVLGWYLHHKWLIERRLKLLGVSSLVLGMLLGIWATTFWLPENLTDPDILTGGFDVGRWSVMRYLLLQIYLGVIYVISHYLLGTFWVDFHPSRLESFVVLLWLGVLFVQQFLIYGVLATFLLLLFISVLTPLYLQRNRSDSSIIEDLHGEIRLKDSLLLLLIPTGAIISYGTISTINPGENTLRLVLELTPFIQIVYGATLLGIAIYKTLRGNQS